MAPAATTASPATVAEPRPELALSSLFFSPTELCHITTPAPAVASATPTKCERGTAFRVSTLCTTINAPVVLVSTYACAMDVVASP